MATFASFYFEAARPEPVRVLGLLLKPFCLGHYLTLTRFDSAFVSDESRNVSREDVIFTALVCHFSYEGFYEYLGQADYQKQLKAWGKQIGIFPIKQKAKLLLEYIRSATDLPPYVVLEQESEKSGSHWSQGMLLCLTGELGYSHSEAMNAPLKKAFADWFKFAENNHIIRFLTEEELSAIELSKADGAEN